MAGLTEYPTYYSRMGLLNRAGAGPVNLTVRTVLDPAELRGRIAAGDWVVDLRQRTAFARGHLPHRQLRA